MSDSLGPRPFEFMPGYPNRKPQQYMNLGFISSPYPDKTGVGDYGPLQGGEVYYRPRNPTYPYPMNFNSDSQGPMLAYEQDIPKFLVRQDQEKLKAGVFGTKAQIQALKFASSQEGNTSYGRTSFGLAPKGQMPTWGVPVASQSPSFSGRGGCSK